MNVFSCNRCRLAPIVTSRSDTSELDLLWNIETSVTVSRFLVLSASEVKQEKP